MSFLGASGTTGGSGLVGPSAPTGVTLTRKIVNNGSTPIYTVSFTPSSTSPKITVTSYTASFYYIVSTTEYIRGSCTITNGGDTSGSFLVTGDHYVRITANSSIGVSSASSNSATVTAMTRPANVGTVTLTGGSNTLNGSWLDVNAGGGAVTYNWVVVNSSTLAAYASSSVTGPNPSFSLSSVPAGTYYATVSASNSLPASQLAAASQSSTVTVVNPPPPPPPPPPYIPPPPPYFPPSFGPYFGCIEAETPIMVWVDGSKLYKKAKEITVGDKLVSYSFNELPESESDYSLDTWSQKFLTPKNLESADVVSVQELITKATMYLNNDINTRMSLDHSVFVKRNETYSIIASGLIEVGDIVIQIDPETMELNEIIVDNIEYIDEESKIYKIDCKPYDVFFAGHILTHNSKKFY